MNFLFSFLTTHFCFSDLRGVVFFYSFMAGFPVYIYIKIFTACSSGKKGGKKKKKKSKEAQFMILYTWTQWIPWKKHISTPIETRSRQQSSRLKSIQPSRHGNAVRNYPPDQNAWCNSREEEEEVLPLKRQGVCKCPSFDLWNVMRGSCQNESAMSLRKKFQLEITGGSVSLSQRVTQNNNSSPTHHDLSEQLADFPPWENAYANDLPASWRGTLFRGWLR